MFHLTCTVSVKASFRATIISVTMAMLLFIWALPGNTSAGAGNKETFHVL